MNMPKSRDIQAKMPSPKVILNAFWPVTVKVLNSYDRRNNSMQLNKKKRFTVRDGMTRYSKK